MRTIFLTALVLFVVAVDATTAAPTADGGDEPRPQPVETAREDSTVELAGPLTWHKGLEPALEEARERKSPILVRVGAEWCGWCRRLDREIAKPEVQQELARWVLVELDADEDQDEVKKLNVGPIPALRVLDVGGRTVRSRDGFLAAKPLVDWLRRAADLGAAGETQPAVVDVPALTAETLPQLVKLLGHRDPEVRDEVIRRLSAERELSAVAVAKTFRQGTLATRLSALDILASWKAPLVDLDPWDPETLTTPRLDALESWAADKTGD